MALPCTLYFVIEKWGVNCQFGGEKSPNIAYIWGYFGICLLHKSTIKKSRRQTFEITTVLNIRPITLKFCIFRTETVMFVSMMCICNNVTVTVITKSTFNFHNNSMFTHYIIALPYKQECTQCNWSVKSGNINVYIFTDTMFMFILHFPILTEFYITTFIMPAYVSFWGQINKDKHCYIDTTFPTTWMISMIRRLITNWHNLVYNRFCK